MNEILRVTLGLIYPVKCLGCGRIIPLNERLEICRECDEAIRSLLIGDDACRICGKPSNGICDKCAEREYYFEHNTAALIYDGEAREMILSLKFREKRQAAVYLGRLMAENIEDLSGVDFILPVPLHKQRMRERGYNQAVLLAEEFVKERGCQNIPIAKDMAVRIRATRPQSELDAAERRKNIENAFKLNPKYDLTGKTVLIVDDVFTTGSTISELAKELKKAGASRVMSMSVSVSVR